ncbi:MAG: hypothetical protein ACI4TK_06165 [Agathobacter sp.]
MKKYKRKTPLVSPLKITIAALYAAIVTATIIIFVGTDNEWYIICSGITASLFIGDLFVIIGAGGRYLYSDKCIEVFWQLLSYKKLDYSWFSAIVISNAPYNNGYGYGINGNIPMQYRVKENNGHTKVTLPFITLHNHQYPINQIKKGMSNRDLFMINNDEIYCLGICWNDSLEELLKHTNCSVYVLEDVYLRFKGQFDTAFSAHKENLDRFYVIADHSIAYQVYIEKN